jgi:hypothetical protein
MRTQKILDFSLYFNILSPMKTPRSIHHPRAPRPLAPPPGTRLFYYNPDPDIPQARNVLDRAAVPLDLFGLALDCAACGLLRLADKAILALHRAYRTRVANTTASLLGAPKPAELTALFTPSPRPLRQALLIGSKLVDLSASNPDTRLSATDSATRAHRFTGRAPGLRGFLSSTCPSIPYSTAMRYRQLAQRTRQALNLSPALPLEWLLSDENPASLTQDSQLLAAIPRARRALASLLACNPTQTALSRTLIKTLDLYPAPLLSRADRASRRRSTRYDAATAQATLNRYATTLSSRLASGAPLSKDEKRALKLLFQLRAALH